MPLVGRCARSAYRVGDQQLIELMGDLIHKLFLLTLVILWCCLPKIIRILSIICPHKAEIARRKAMDSNEHQVK